MMYEYWLRLDAKLEKVLILSNPSTKSQDETKESEPDTKVCIGWLVEDTFCACIYKEHISIKSQQRNTACPFQLSPVQRDFKALAVHRDRSSEIIIAK